MVVLDPEPDTLPGLIVQLPVGNPLNTRLPVALPQVGCVIVPTTGTNGVTGCGRMVKLPEDDDTHPTAFVTV